MRFVHEGMWAVTLGLEETLRPGETTTGIPFARVWVDKARRAVSEGRLTVNMLIPYRLREDWGGGFHKYVHSEYEDIVGAKRLYISSDESWNSARQGCGKIMLTEGVLPRIIAAHELRGLAHWRQQRLRMKHSLARAQFSEIDKWPRTYDDGW